MITRAIRRVVLVFVVLAAATVFAQPGEGFQRVGAWPYGPSRGVGLDPARGLIFLGSGGVCLILDGTGFGDPVLVNDDIHTQGLVWDVAYDPAHQRLFLACGEGGLEIWDVSVPTQPARLSVTEVLYFGYDTPVGGVELWGDHAIVECEWGYVHSLDVSDPTAPFQVSFNGLMGNPARDIHISKDGQVHSTGADRFQRLGIDPDGTLHNTGYKDFTYGPATVYGKPEVAYVGYGGLCYIVDLLHPAWPFWSHFDPGGVGDIAVPGRFAYIVNSSGLHVWNVTVHNDPIFNGTAAKSLYPYYLRLAVGAGRGYVAANNDGLQIAALGDPTQPVWVGHFDVPSVTWQTATDGVHAYVAHSSEGLLVLELGDQTRPMEVGRMAIGSEARDIVLRGGLVYVADLNTALRIVDVADPANPVEIGAWAEAGGWRLALDGDLACCIEAIANQPYFLHTVDVSDPMMPGHLGTLEIPTLAWGLAAAGGYAYVAALNNGVQVIDLSDPASPTEVGLLPVPDSREVRIQEGVLYVTSGDAVDGGLFTFDLADPAAPTPLGHYTTTGFRAFHLDVEGDYAYLNDGEDLQLVFVGDPTAPVRLDEYRMPGDLFGIRARDRFVYVSDGSAGLQIVENLLFDDPGGGLQWYAQNSGTGADLKDLDFVDGARGWVVGDGGTVLHTVNGGATWSPQTSGTTADLAAVDFVDPQTGWAVGNTAITTTDGGVTWQSVAIDGGALLTDVYFVTTSTGWIVGDDGLILATVDGGQTWQPQPSGTGVGLFAVDFADALHGWVATSNYGVCLRTENGGASWQSVDTGSSAILLDLDFATAQTGWAVGMFGEILRTTDGGASWQPQEGVHPPDWLYGVKALDAQHVWTVGFAGKIMTTTDGGNQWQAQSSGSDNQLNAVTFADRQHGWCCGESGTILAWGPEPATEVAEPDPSVTSTVPVPVLYPNHPNPFNPATEITFTLPVAGHAQVAVFDLAGRRVRVLADRDFTNGKHAIVWDGLNGAGRPAPSGTYICRLHTGVHSATRTLTLVR